nr:MAG TPA: hypothetical protein [Bacteriophage sp.]
MKSRQGGEPCRLLKRCVRRSKLPPHIINVLQSRFITIFASLRKW